MQRTPDRHEPAAGKSPKAGCEPWEIGIPQTTVSVKKTLEALQTVGDLAASAIHHVADAFDLVNQSVAIEWRMREVRQLADAIAVGTTFEPIEAAKERIVVGMNITKDGPVASAFHVRNGVVTPMAEFNAQLAAMKAHVPLWTLSWDGDRFHVTDGMVTANTATMPPDTTVQDRIVAINGLVRGMRITMANMERVAALHVDEHGKATPIYGDAPSDGSTVYKWTLLRNGDRLVLSDGRQVIEYQLPDAMNYDDMRDALHLLIDGLHGGHLTKARSEALRTEGFERPALARSREVRTAVLALQKALGVGEDGIVGQRTIKAIEGISTCPNPPSDAKTVRVVQVYDTDEDAMGRVVLVIDLALEGHGDPFHPGDLVVQSSGNQGIQEVHEIEVRPNAKTLIGLAVRPVRRVSLEAEAF